MEGTITQLGLENYLINEKLPKESFFKHSYKNYYNFGRDTRKIQFYNNPKFGGILSIKISDQARYGDLINNIVLEFELPDLTNLLSDTNNQVGYCNGIGYAMIKEAILKVGGNVINTISGEWMYTWTKLCIPSSKQDALNDNIKYFQNSTPSNFQGGIVHIPLTFWFCQLVGSKNKQKLSFPLIALKNAEVELIIKLRNLSELIITNDNSTVNLNNLDIINNNILIDYIILSPEERMKYINAKRQMYLINQIQEIKYNINATDTVANINLRNFKYPITELIWVIRPINNLNNNDYFNYTNSYVGDPYREGFYNTAKLIFDGRDRIPELNYLSFINDEPLKVHSNVPNKLQISCYSFSLDPENFNQPSGNCNFSGLHEPRLIINLRKDIHIPDSELILFAINYNVLQIDDKGNVWLLHNLSKSSPNELPDINTQNYLDACNLTIKEANNAKKLIAEINKLNLFNDPRTIETGLQNIINDAKKKEIVDARTTNDCINPNEGEFDSGYVNPLLNSLTDEIKRINQIIAKNKEQNNNGTGYIFTDDTKQFIDIGGKYINVKDFNIFIKDLLNN